MANLNLDPTNYTRLAQFLTDDGDATSDENANINYSVPATSSYYVQAPTNRAMIVKTLTFYAADNGFFSADTFAARQPLTSGIKILHKDSAQATVCDITGPNASIKTNSDFLRNGATSTYENTGTNKAAAWTFDFGHGIILTSDETLEVILQDDFSSLVKFTMYCTGLVCTVDGGAPPPEMSF
jgi:hypothetical protein